MTQKLTSHRRTLALLLAAAALPLNPAFGQDVTTAPAQPPVVNVPPVTAPPTAAPAPVVVTPPAPTVVAPAPAPVVTPPPAPETAAEPPARTARATPPRRTTATSATRSATRTRAPATEPALAPAPSTAPLAATSAPAEAPAAVPAPAPTETAPTAAAPAPDQPAQPARSIWPWLLGAIILVGAAALLLMRRRRRDDVYHEERFEPEVVAAPVMMPPLAVAPTIAPAAVAPEVAAAEPGRPAIALRMRPKRAGVEAEDVIAEFELTVDNRGDAAARDVRISTWMFPAGQASEAERMLIQDADQSAGTIGSGDRRKIDRTVALPTSEIAQDAVLPVVVAEASYRLPDGTEERTSASFEVGVQVDDDLAYFDLENPSGLHEDVVARPHRELADA